MKLHPLTLKYSGFSVGLENSFQTDNFRNSLPYNRAALLIAVCFYSVFGILDALLIPENKADFWFIRFAIVNPALIVTFALSFTNSFSRYAHPLLAGVSILAGAGIIWMIVIAPPPVNYSYYAGIMLVFIWNYTFLRIPFLWALLAGWSLVALYEIVAIGINETPLAILINNNFFFVSANIMGMIACYFLEYSTRRNYYLTRQIDSEREKIDLVNQDLENKTIEHQIVNRRLAREINERRQVEEALRKSQELYTKLVNAIPDTIVHIDLAGNILFVNDYALQISGYRREEIEGMPMLNFIAAEDQNKAVVNTFLMMEARLGPQEYHMMMKDGRKILFEVNGDVLRNEDGTAFGIVHLCRDISDRKQAEEERQHREKLQGILEMAGAVCHEMNQPMQVISGLAELLLMKNSPNDKHYNELTGIIRQIQRMQEITGKLMTIRHYKSEDYAGFARIVDIHYSPHETAPEKGIKDNGKKKDTDC